MRAEDIREGMWLVSDRGDVGKVRRVFAQHAQVVTLHGERPFWPDSCAPWVPRPGDWVFVLLCGKVARVVRVDLRSVLLSFDDGNFWWGVGDVEPCAPPEAKPTERTPEQAAFIATLEGEIHKAKERVLASLAEFQALPALVPPEPPRDHNATCARCGGRAYQGLLNAECIEPVCDDPRARMPEVVFKTRKRMVDYQNRETTVNGVRVTVSADDYVEWIWRATGRGVVARHPTKEGAIAAWREAVSR